jgi:hypothetical protein
MPEIALSLFPLSLEGEAKNIQLRVSSYKLQVKNKYFLVT